MKNRTLLGGVFYPSRVANIGADQTRSGFIHSFISFFHAQNIAQESSAVEVLI
jgi:hypothetical protein